MELLFGVQVVSKHAHRKTSEEASLFRMHKSPANTHSTFAKAQHLLETLEAETVADVSTSVLIKLIIVIISNYKGK